MRLALALLVLLAPLSSRGGLPPRYGGELAVALPATPAELDPARATAPADLAAVRALHATLVEMDASGALRPGLLAALPEPEPGGRAFLLRLEPGLRFHDGSPVTAADVAHSLARLLDPRIRSPHAWIALAIQGADDVREGRAQALSGVEVLSDSELRVALDAPFPELPRALAALPAAVLPRSSAAGVGAGPFRLAGRGPGGALRLAAFDGFHRGRPYADAVTLAGMDARRLARAFARGEVDLALRPEAPPGASALDLQPLTAVWALVRGPRAGAIRLALETVDRSELARRSTRGPAAPLAALLPPALLPAPPPAAAPYPATPLRAGGGYRLALLVPAAAELPRAVADRLQVRLFDHGFRAAVEPLPPEALAARLASGDYDLALVTVGFAASSPALAVVEAAFALGGASAARRALGRLGSAEPGAVAAEIAADAGAVPLFASGLRVSPRRGLEGLAPAPDGGVELGDLWTLPAPDGR
jgi:peptide/nickel transport system substrate-binding protein